MSLSSPHLVLLRKELRQLAPLALAVLLLGALCFMSYELQPADWQNGVFPPVYILLGMPALFSVGAGAMSISQEKETRTLSWLSSLPLERNRLIATKFIAATIDLAGLWLIAVLSCYTIDYFGWAQLFPFINSAGHPIYSAWLSYWLLNSFYLLVCGFLTAWRFESSMSSLIAFIPCAIAPAMLRFGLAYLNDPFHNLNSSRYDATLGQNLLATGCLLAVAVWLMIRFAERALAPRPSPVSENPYAASAPTIDTTIQSSQSVLSPSTAMLWQFYRQHQTVYLSMVGASLIAGTIILVAADSSSQSHQFPWEVLAMGSVLLITSWMGVMVFQGDNLQERIRFLAERGVTPFKAWITRQLIPFAFVCAASLFYLLIRQRYDTLHPGQVQAPLWAVFCGLLGLFGYSQWFSQIVRNPVLSAIGSPLIVVAAAMYLVYSTIELLRPEIFVYVIYAIVFAIAPFVATLLMMRRWMDRRFQWHYWCTHLAILCCVIAIPLVNLAWYVWNSPRMPDNVKIALRREGAEIEQSAPSTNPIPLSQMLYQNLTESAEHAEQTIEDRLKFVQNDQNIDVLTNDLQNQYYRDSGFWIVDESLHEVIGPTVLSRQRLEADLENLQNLKDYKANMALLATIAQGLRRGTYLKGQDQADIAEIALIAELEQPKTAERIGAEAWKHYIALVSNPTARNHARRRAVVASWFNFDQLDSDKKLSQGLSENIWRRFQSITKRSLTWVDRNDHTAWVLLRYLEAGPTATDAQKLNFLQQRWPWDSNELQPYAFFPPAWVDDPARFTFRTTTGYLPGDQWFAGWEHVGMKLGQQP